MNNDFIIKDGVLVDYKGAGDDVVIPNGVTRIGVRAFFLFNAIKSVIIPNSVIHIEYSAFAGCTNLASVAIPNTVTSIGYWAFEDCANLMSIAIPDSVTAIEKGAFNGCKKLTSNNKNLRFKATDNKMRCKGFQYSLGKWFETYGDVKLCERGFHSCKNPMDVFNYYGGELGKNVRLWLVETDGEMKENKIDSKVVSRRIRFVKELTISELANYTK